MQVQAPTSPPFDLQHDWLLVAGQDAQGVPLAEVAQIPGADLSRKRERAKLIRRPCQRKSNGPHAQDLYQRHLRFHQRQQLDATPVI